MAPSEWRNDANCSFLESIISDIFSRATWKILDIFFVFFTLCPDVPLQVRWAAQRVRLRHRQLRKVHCLEAWQKHSWWCNVAIIALCKESRRIQRGEGYLAAPMARHGASWEREREGERKQGVARSTMMMMMMFGQDREEKNWKLIAMYSNDFIRPHNYLRPRCNVLWQPQ